MSVPPNLYTDAHIRARMTEFLGGSSLESATAVYLADQEDDIVWRWSARPVSDLYYCLEDHRDLTRSLWDREYLLIHLDVEYVNFDFPGEPYLDPERSFELQAPVVESIYTTLNQLGIRCLHLLSGRGHHFVWQIHQTSEAFRRLTEFGHILPSLEKRYAEIESPSGEHVTEVLARAFAGLGQVIEFLAHRIQESAAVGCRIPVQITDLVVGPVERGREIVCLDISEYGDPLHTRKTGLPFSTYQKPERRRPQIGEHVVTQLPTLFVVPVSREVPIALGIRAMRNVDDVLRIARETSTFIPTQDDGTATLIEEYTKSDLARFHRWFYSEEHDPPEKWPASYDRTPLELLPKCVRIILEEPNDHLLNLSYIQLLTRSLLALGWHPRHIAGLIRSKYERDFGWGDRWRFYDPAFRADFYTRLFAGLIQVGRDEGVDFTCWSTKEKGQCIQPNVGCAIDEFKESLLLRRKHERMACRPFNRLLLPEKHS